MKSVSGQSVNVNQECANVRDVVGVEDYEILIFVFVLSVGPRG